MVRAPPGIAGRRPDWERAGTRELGAPVVLSSAFS